jgi:hypothetical protein
MPENTLKARNGDAITCSKGHVVGHFVRDIPRDRNIESADLGFTDRGIMSPGDGHECPECKEPVALFSMRDRTWRVHSASGWIS